MNTSNLPAPSPMHEAAPVNQHSGLPNDAETLVINQIRPAFDYAGDISAELAFQWFTSGEAVLVDVRTEAEREWVGFIPGAVGVPWKTWPGMALNPSFDQLIKAAVTDGKKALMLCRSGVRSVAAAKRATELGIEAFNILEGFEGDPDQDAHRGKTGGWRKRGLPWRQG